MTPGRRGSIERAAGLAFAGRLGAASRILDALHAPDDETLWLRAYLLTATGSFARAESAARSVLGRTRDPILFARAAITLGSVLRQTDRHGEARPIEATALRATLPKDLRAHLHIGLAADAVGLGRLAAVDRELGRAASMRSREWRARVRLLWVRCERELLAGRPAHAARHARAALAAAERADARRHVAKSLLFLGAAAAASDPSASDRALRRARASAARIGARPIERVAGELLGRAASRR